MPVTVVPVYGSYNYTTGNADVETWDDQLRLLPVVVPIPRSDRARDADGYLRPREVQVRGTIGLESWTDREELRTALDAFLWAHRPGRRNLYRDSDRYLKNAQVEDVRIKDEGLLWVAYDVRFLVADPYWYSTAADSDTWNTPATTDTRAIDNQGSATALPVFTVTFSSTGTLELTLTNDTTGKNFTISGLAVESGQALVVDCDAETAKLAGANVMSYFSGDFFALDPGSNTLELTLSGVTLALIGTAYTKRWL